MRKALPYLMWDRSAMSVMPAIFCIARRGVLGDRNSESVLSDSMDALEADITVLAIERYMLLASVILMVCGLMCWGN